MNKVTTWQKIDVQRKEIIPRELPRANKHVGVYIHKTTRR